MSGDKDLVVIGGGLAGSEAAWQAAQRGLRVTLYEMRPVQSTYASPQVEASAKDWWNTLGM